MKRLVLLMVLVSGGLACDDDGQGGKRDADAGGRDTPAALDGPDAGGDMRDGTGSEPGADAPTPLDVSSDLQTPTFTDAEGSLDVLPAADLPPREWMVMSDFDGVPELPVFWAMYVGGRDVGDGSGEAPTSPVNPARGASRVAMRLMGPAVADGAIANVHHNFDSPMLFTGIRFWARATAGDQPTEILVALTDLRSSRELYYAGLRAMRPWRVKRLRLTADWQQFTVTYGELAPEGAGTPVPLTGTGGSELHFIVPENRAYDVWIDDIELGCKTGRCGPGFI